MTQQIRPTIDEYFMNIAEVIATRSTCIRRKVGAVIVKDKQIISTGYNGSPKKLKHCLDIGCIRDQKNIESGTMHEICRGVHAEQNAIIQAATHGISTKDASLYCTHQPCIICTKMIINANIINVVFKESYPDDSSINFFIEANIQIKNLKLK